MPNFEWDPAKAARNVTEHKVSFEAARRVFDDPFALDEIDGQTFSAWWRAGSSSSRTH